MNRAALLLVLFIGLASCASNSRNLYQTCTNAGKAQYYNYWGTSYDFGAGVLPYDAKNYTFFNQTNGETLYFNLCAGLDVCEGAMACLVDKAGVVFTYTYPFFGSENIYGGTLQFCCSSGMGKYLYISLSCSTTTTMTINSYETFYGNQIQIYASSIYGCPTTAVAPTYVAPQYYSSFSAPFYMKGRLPYFLQDYLGDTFDTEFVGNIYYSTTYGLTINGTISIGSQSHFVSFIYEKQIPFNPPRAVSFIQIAENTAPVCRIQGISDTDDYDFADDIFNTYENEWISLQREYTPVHFNTGSSFMVNTYTQNRYDTQASLITRVSDGKVVYISPSLISPWTRCCNIVGQFIDEINWNSISSVPLGKESFTPPTTWDCGF